MWRAHSCVPRRDFSRRLLEHYTRTAHMMEFFQWLQATPWSTWLRESTWGYPILAAIHVLGLAWFGGAVLKDLPAGKRMGLVFMTVTGAVLFYMSPVRCYQSYAFRIKILLLLTAVFVGPGFRACRRLLGGVLDGDAQRRAKARRQPQRADPTWPVSVACWIGMIFAARGIAFF
jgi:hypothetical protein